MLEDYLNTKQALELLGNRISIMTLHRWCNEDKLEHIRLNRRLFIKKQSLVEFISKK